jgi:hypothetical protein
VARASAAGQLALYVLELDGAVIAFRLALRAAGRCDSLKTGYRPEWAAYGPGVLGKFLMARREIADGEVRTLHFGPPSEEKLRWSTGVTRLVTLRVYAPTSRGRLARAAPALLGTFDRWRPAGAALARGRAAFARLKERAHRARVHLGKLRRHRDTGRAPRAAAARAAVTLRPLTRPSDPIDLGHREALHAATPAQRAKQVSRRASTARFSSMWRPKSWRMPPEVADEAVARRPAQLGLDAPHAERLEALEPGPVRPEEAARGDVERSARAVPRRPPGMRAGDGHVGVEEPQRAAHAQLVRIRARPVHPAARVAAIRDEPHRAAYGERLGVELVPREGDAARVRPTLSRVTANAAARSSRSASAVAPSSRQ